jgi:hypothetical protein
MEAVREMLRHPNVSIGFASVVLSDHFVRYLVLPWSAALVSDAEQLEFARARFLKVFGDAAQRWTVLISPAPAGHPRLAAAVEQPLIHALNEAFAASPLKLKSIQPAFVAHFNGARSKLASNAWIVMAEQGRLLIAHLTGGRWRSVRTRPVNGVTIPLAQLLEQERMLLASDDAGAPVYVSVFDDVTVDLSGVQAQVMQGRSEPPAVQGERFTVAAQKVN